MVALKSLPQTEKNRDHPVWDSFSKIHKDWANLTGLDYSEYIQK